jgi:hypothetical protein
MCPRENGTYHTMFMCDRYLNLSPTQAILGKVDEGNTWSELSHDGLYIIYYDLMFLTSYCADLMRSALGTRGRFGSRGASARADSAGSGKGTGSLGALYPEVLAWTDDSSG